MKNDYSHIIKVLLGTTAVGKTRLACHYACRNDAEIISADSRQVYKGMDIGTGKDLEEYSIEGTEVPYHLINICDPGETYNLFRFKEDFTKVAEDIINRGKEVLLCGGTGMYMDALIRNYDLREVPENKPLREQLEKKSTEELITQLLSLRKHVHNTTDTLDRDRLFRAIEIAEYEAACPAPETSPFKYKVFGIMTPREVIKERITERLKKRLKEGMIEEVEALIRSGVSEDSLMYYGLEYRYITMYLQGGLSYNDMYQKLNSAIHRFAKRQMTFFRSMEKKGVEIQWIDFSLSLEEKLKILNAEG